VELKINPTTGRLTSAGEVAKVSSPVSIVFVDED